MLCLVYSNFGVKTVVVNYGSVVDCFGAIYEFTIGRSNAKSITLFFFVFWNL